MIIKDKIYGAQNVDDPLILDLLLSPELERLKGVGQYGTWGLIDKRFNTTRFEHSFGVYLLLKRFGADKEEMIAGLLHDVNHTAFSHVVDYVLGDPSTQEFSDNKHKDIISNSSLPVILKKYDIDANKVSDHHSFSLLDNNLPDLCCDRLDYCLRDSTCCGFIDQKQVADILDDVFVHDGELICRNKGSAHRLAYLFLKTSRFLWSNEIQVGSFSLLAEAMKIAIRERIVTLEEFYTTDEILLGKLIGSGNSEIKHLIDSIRRGTIVLGTKEDHDIFGRSKARYIDPKFMDGSSIKRLSEVDPNFRKDIEDFRSWIAAGFYIKIRK
jgi:hypothetical protein